MKQLFDPLRFRNGVSAANRIALAPMTNQQSHTDGTLGADELRWLSSRADSGFGVVTTCAAHVTPDGQGWAGELGIWDDKHLPGLGRLASALRARGATSMVQIFHGGLRADPKVTGELPWSASEGQGVRAGTEEDIERVVHAFADAAVRAHDAGFDGVEIHGAHGYLLTQFLSATENRRGDAWGGSLENRARLLRDVTRAVRANVPARFLVGVRLSPEDWGNAKGLDVDENVQVARWLAEDGVDFLHLSLWRAHLNLKKHPETHPVPFFRASLPEDLAILVAGSIWTRADAENLLALGADGIAIGRSAIVNADWPLRVRNESWEPRRPPADAAALVKSGLSSEFVEYLRAWKGFVA